jgi:hypothetical protein
VAAGDHCRVAQLSAALLLTALAALALAAPAHAVSSAQIVNVINAERHANGLPPVREDPALSAGCADYDRYRQMNGSLANAYTLGGEDPSKPGYTAAGNRASRDSLLNAGDRPADSFANGDVFDDAPGHLMALMDPAVAVIGADQLDFEVSPFFGIASLSCIDVRSAPSRARPRRLREYAYVGPDGRAPRTPSYREGPRGVGPLVFLYFDAPKGARVTLRSLTLRRSDGSSAQPSFVAISGGLVDGRSGARAANKTKPSRTPAAEIGDQAPQYDPADDLDFIGAILAQGHSHAFTGHQSIPFQ